MKKIIVRDKEGHYKIGGKIAGTLSGRHNNSDLMFT